MKIFHLKMTNYNKKKGVPKEQCFQGHYIVFEFWISFKNIFLNIFFSKIIFLFIFLSKNCQTMLIFHQNGKICCFSR